MARSTRTSPVRRRASTPARRVDGLGVGVQGSGFKVDDLGVGVQGLGYEGLRDLKV